MENKDLVENKLHLDKQKEYNNQCTYKWYRAPKEFQKLFFNDSGFREKYYTKLSLHISINILVK